MMTSDEWERCNNPAELLEALRFHATPAMLRLIVCELIYIGPKHPNPGPLNVARRYALGEATKDDLKAAETEFIRALNDELYRFYSGYVDGLEFYAGNQL